MSTESSVQFLFNELTKRVEKNPRYSMRAFAKSLDINIGVLSSLLSGKRPLTARTAEKLLNRLNVDPKQSAKILRLVKNQSSVDSNLKDRIELAQEVFNLASSWYHWAILQLIRTDNYSKKKHHSSAKWMATQLGISETEATLAIKRLTKLELLQVNPNGFFERTKSKLTTTNKDTTTSALKKWQKEIRQKAITSLEHDPIATRSMTSMCMAIDPNKLAEAKIMIDEFQEKLSDFLEGGEKKQVYQMCMSLFPLQVQEQES